MNRSEDSSVQQQATKMAYDSAEVIDRLSLAINEISKGLSRFDSIVCQSLNSMDERLLVVEKQLAFLENRVTSVIPNQNQTSQQQ
ncbi:hypothetical protein MP228_009214 [Amoeboaphelidium protococcarum]|nr:hypothetical protein MP228_009214 [Amoeboaphelidium protococcarum]